MSSTPFSGKIPISHEVTTMTKYVFVTGGVVSSLGKGIAAASLAAILESRKIKVSLVKLDPYITDEIKTSIKTACKDAEVGIIEIGGTVGDIESLPFLEAIRQMGIEEGRTNTCYMHLTLVPHLASVGEIKTKPTQHSVKELRGIGIQPDIVMCRSEVPIPEEDRRKIALFTNVDVRSVISASDADSIYKIPV